MKAPLAAFLAATLLVAACSTQQPRGQDAAPPLLPDPELAQQIELEQAERRFLDQAARLTAREVDELEARLKRRPRSFDIRKQLRHFYQVSGAWVLGASERNARRREHVLWLIEYHPDHELAAWPIPPSEDPEGYAAAKGKWLEKTRLEDATPQTLSNAAVFFRAAEPLLTEQLLLQARSADPEGRAVAPGEAGPTYWSKRLGRLYSELIKGAGDEGGEDPYLRRKLLETEQDVVLLTAAGEDLARTASTENRRHLGRQLLQRALQIAPQRPEPRRVLAALEEEDRLESLQNDLRLRAGARAGGEIAEKAAAGTLSRDERIALRKYAAEVIGEVPEDDRLVLLPLLIEQEYVLAEGLDALAQDKAAARAAWARSKQYAEQTRTLARRRRDHPQRSRALYDAYVALGLHAIRAGDREGAVRHMFAAAVVRPSTSPTVRGSALDTRLVNALLDAGERESVAVFLEGSARLRPDERDRLLADAAAIRAGRMPPAYQRWRAQQPR